MSLQYYVVCVIYPKFQADLDQAPEIVFWPPQLEDEEEFIEPVAIAEATEELTQAEHCGRMFIIQAEDEDDAVECLESYFGEHQVEPVSVTFLDLDQELAPELLEPLQSESPDTTCCYPSVPLFAITSLEDDDVTEWFQFCWEIMDDSDDEEE